MTNLDVPIPGEDGTTHTEQVHVYSVSDEQLREVDRMDDDVNAVVDQIIRAGDAGPELAQLPQDAPGDSSTRPPARGQTDVQQSAPRSTAEIAARRAVSNAAATTPATPSGNTPGTAASAAARAALAAAPASTSIPLSRLDRTGGPEPTHAELLQEHRQVNDLKHLERHLPADLRGGMRYILSPLRVHFESPAAFEGFVTRQSNMLQAEGITGKAGLLDLARIASRRDNLMAAGESTVGGTHFNMPGLAFTYGPLPVELTAGGAARTNALQGALSGVVAGLSDATATPAKAATFNDAYYKRPDARHLPENLRNLNAPNLSRSIGEGAAAWTAAFGGSYLVRGGVMAATTLAQGPEMAVAVESAIAPVANIAAGVAAKFITHKLDERQGRTGLPLFFARENLPECVQATRTSTLAYAGAAVTGVATHAKNTVMKFPAGVKAATTDLGLVASTASLSLGLAGPSTLSGMVQGSFKDQKVGHLLGSITKYIALEAAWTGWAASSAVGADLQAKRS